MKGNPYVGPASLAEGQRIYGRDREIATVGAMLIAERIVLLYSPSGAGKSSLLQAGIIPAMKKRGFAVRPLLRVNAEPPLGAGFDRATGNRYTLSCLLSVEARLEEKDRRSPAELSRLTLVEYFGESPGGELLIFDQFEEVLTVDPTDYSEKKEFFGQLGDLLRTRGRWAILAMREDYLAGIDPYGELVPTRLSNTFRLDLLGPEAAAQAICRPAADAEVKVDFGADAAAALVANLRQIQVQREDGTAEVALGKYVEPVQLQLACYRLWEDLPEGASGIHEIGAVAMSVDAALEGYYERAVGDVAAKSGVSERVLRDWFDGELITRRGTRTQVTQADDRTEPVRAALRLLVDAFLVRSERRLGSIFYELAHDRLIKPVQSANRTWRLANLSPFQRSAEVWEEQRRSKDGLLRGEALEAAREWSARNPLTEVEKAFLEASEEADAVRAREARQAEELREALADARRALARFEMEQVSRLWSEGKPAAALANLASALRLDAESKRARLWAASFFSRGTGRIPARELDHGSPISMVAFSGDGRWVLTGYSMEAVRVWDAETGASLGPTLPAAARRALLSHDGRLVITFPRDAVNDPTAYVWDVVSGEAIGGSEGAGLLRDGAAIVAAMVTSDGNRIVAVGRERGVFTVDLGDLSEKKFEAEAGGAVSAASFSEDENVVVTVAGGTVRVWDLRAGSNRSGVWESVVRAEVSADGSKVVVIAVGETVLWDVGSDAKVRIAGAVTAAGFNADGSEVVTVDEKGLTRWKASDGRRIAAWARRPEDREVVYGAGSGVFAVLGEELIALRDLATFLPLAQAYPRGAYDAYALSRDGGKMASASCAQPVADIWDMSPASPLDEALEEERAAFAAVPPPKPVQRPALLEMAKLRWGNREVPRFVRSAVFSPSGKRLLVSGEADFYFDEPPEIWDAETGKLVAKVRPGGAQHPAEGTTYTAAFSGDDRCLGIADSQGWVQLFDGASGIHLGHPLLLPPPVECGLFSEAGTELLAAAGDGSVRMWSPQTAQPEGGEWFEHTAQVRAIMETAGGARLVTSTGDRVYGWDLRLGAPDAETAAVLADLAEALSGYRKPSGPGSLECISLEERRRTMRELRARAGALGDLRVMAVAERFAPHEAGG